MIPVGRHPVARDRLGTVDAAGRCFLYTVEKVSVLVGKYFSQFAGVAVDFQSVLKLPDETLVPASRKQHFFLNWSLV